MQVIGTAGHVDHGKSTLVERLTGIDPDRFAEEKRRGLTIDLGFAWLPLPSGNEVGLIDVPGHERFIKNMLAGAGGMSVSLFVVAANEGWKPQSAEHLSILHLLAITSGVVALTKADLVSSDELEARRAEVREHIDRSTLAGAPIVPVSATTGSGIEELVRELDQAVSNVGAALDRDRPRLWVDRVFTIAGAGTVVTGTLAGGSLDVGADVDLAPAGRRARVRTIQSHKKGHNTIGPGNRVAMNLVGLDRHDAKRGDAVVSPGRWRASRRVDVVVEVLPEELSGHRHELTEKGSHLFYSGSAEVPTRVKVLDRDRVGPGERAFAQLTLRDPLPLYRGDRFILRDAGRILTFGGGVVLDPLASPARRGDRERLQILEQLDGASDASALAALVAGYGSLPSDEALLRSGAVEVGTNALLGETLVSPTRLHELQEKLRVALKGHHASHPLEAGAARAAMRAEVELPAPEFDDLLTLTRDVVEEGPGVRLEGFSVELDPTTVSERAALLERLDAGGFSPPFTKELGADSALLRALERTGDIVRIGDFHVTGSGAERAKDLVRRAIKERGPLTVAEIRDLLGTTRKYAVPLCEWLDATGTTMRRGDVRTLGPHA